MEQNLKYIKIYNYYVKICESLGGKPIIFPEFKKKISSHWYNLDDMISTLEL